MYIKTIWAYSDLKRKTTHTHVLEEIIFLFLVLKYLNIEMFLNQKLSERLDIIIICQLKIKF